MGALNIIFSIVYIVAGILAAIGGCLFMYFVQEFFVVLLSIYLMFAPRKKTTHPPLALALTAPTHARTASLECL